MPQLLQDWVIELPLMQQTVLLTATRARSGLTQIHDMPNKMARNCTNVMVWRGR